MEIPKPANQQRVLVDFTPAPHLTNNMIANLNRMATELSPQEFAFYIASQVSALAFVMHSNNSSAQITKLFDILVKTAGAQFEHRRRLIEKEMNNPLRHKP